MILQQINARDDDSSTVRKTAQDASIRQPLFFHINWVIFKKKTKNIENTLKIKLVRGFFRIWFQ